MTKRVVFQALALLFARYSFMQTSSAQERIKISYSAVDSSNSVWYVAQEKGFFKKHGLEVAIEVLTHRPRPEDLLPWNVN